MLDSKVSKIFGLIVYIKWELVEPNELTETEKFRKQLTIKVLLEELQTTLGRERFEKYIEERKLLLCELKTNTGQIPSAWSPEEIM